MATTVIIVETLITGFFAWCWILLLIHSVSPFDIKLPADIPDWSSPVTIIAVILLYQLGLIMSWISARLAKCCLCKKYRDPIFAGVGVDYNSVKAMVFQKGSQEIHRELRYLLSTIRMTRSGVINFVLIAVALMVLEPWYYGVIMLIIPLLCFLAFIEWYQKYYRKILDAYRVIQYCSEKQEC